jgi:hypothetical protein
VALFTMTELASYVQGDVDSYTGTLAHDAALGAIQAVTGQQIVTATSTDVAVPRLATDTCVVVLPQAPVQLVSSVTDEDAVAVDYTHRGGQRLYSTCGFPEWVLVTYTHGYTTVPLVVKAVALSVAARLLSNPEGVTQTMVGDVSAMYASSGTGPALTDRERALLAPFRVRSTMVGVS